MLSALLALGGAFVYGAADFAGGLAARRLRSLAVTAISAVAGLIGLLIALPFFGGRWSAADALWGAAAGAFGVTAVVLLYACLAIGPMSILSPLTAVVSAIAPMIWGLAVNGETLSPIGYAGLAVAVVAVVLVGFIPGETAVRPSLRGLLMAIGAGIAIGGFLIVLDHSSPDSGLVPLVVSRATNAVVTVAILAALAVITVRRGRPAASVFDASGLAVGATPSGHADLEHAVAVETFAGSGMTARRAWTLAAVCGVLDAGANVAMLIAMRLGDLSVVSALTALYPSGTIVLAAIVLRERVAAVQWAGLALALAAGGMLAVG